MKAPNRRRTRILHVITRLVVGGAQENTLLTVAHLDRDRYEIALVSGPTTGPEGSLEDRIPADIAFIRIPELVRHPHPAWDVAATARLYLLMRSNRFDIVHTHTTKAGMLGRIAARLAGVPVVIHTPHGHAFHDYLNGPASRALTAVERWLARWTDQIVCLTPAERHDHIRLGIGPPAQFEVIHSGVDLDVFQKVRVDRTAKRRAAGLPQNGALVGCVARLVPVKGVDVLLEATPQITGAVPGSTVVFVGDGPMRPLLQRRALELGLNGKVVFLGLRRDVPELLPLFDVVVLPSRNEGMGKAAVEALAAGQPVVATRVSGIQDVIRDGQTGVLVPPGDPKALAGGITHCLLDPEWASGLARRAQETLAAYGIEQMVAKIDQLYARLLPPA